MEPPPEHPCAAARETIREAADHLAGHLDSRRPTGSTRLPPEFTRGPGFYAGMAGWCSSLLVVVLAALLLADGALAQTFSYSRGWKSGKRAGVAVPGGATPGGRDDVLAEDLPLYRYILEGRGEHRAAYDPWRVVDEPMLHRRPALQALQALQQTGEQAAEHEDR